MIELESCNFGKIVVNVRDITLVRPGSRYNTEYEQNKGSTIWIGTPIENEIALKTPYQEVVALIEKDGVKINRRDNK